MTSPRQRRREWLLGLASAVGLVAVARRETRSPHRTPPTQSRGGRTWVRVNGGAEPVGSARLPDTPMDTVRADSGWILAREVRVHDFVGYLNEQQPDSGWSHPQVEWRDRAWRAREGLQRAPLAFVGAEEAEALAAWMGRLAGRRGRLPREAEWLRAARAGRCGHPYVGGFRVPEAGPAPYHPWGLEAVGSGVWEWCRDNLEEHQWVLKGGSDWETAPDWRHLARRWQPSPDHRGADVGLRVWLEESSSRRG